MQTLIFGIITGSILAMASLGFAMVRQSEGFLHIGHGQYIALGAFFGWTLTDAGASLFLAGVLVFVAVGVVGVVLGLLVFDPVRDKGGIILLFTSVGVAYAIYALITMGFGVEVRTYDVDFGTNIGVGSASITVAEILMIVVMLVSVGALSAFLSFTRMGTWIRATASNPDLARVRGIPTRRVSSVVWLVASGLGGVAGILIGINSSVSTEIGWNMILLVLAASVLGGLGKIYGAVAASLLLGIVMQYGAELISSAYSLGIAFLSLIMVLILRPEGIFSRRRRSEQTA